MLTRFTGPGFTVDQDCSDLKGVFRFIAKCKELFGAATCCENCQGTELTPQYRQNGGYEFYSVVCDKCGYEFKYGQRKEDQQLFPKGWEPPYNGGGGGGDAPIQDGPGTAPPRPTSTAPRPQAAMF